MTYWSSRKNAEFVVCEVPVVKKQHTSTEEQTFTQHLPVCWLSLYSASVTFPLFVFFTSVSVLFLLRSVKFTVVPLLPVDGNQGKQCLFLSGLCNGSHASCETGGRLNSTVAATCVLNQSSCGWWHFSTASISFRMKHTPEAYKSQLRQMKVL